MFNLCTLVLINYLVCIIYSKDQVAMSQTDNFGGNFVHKSKI